MKRKPRDASHEQHSLSQEFSEISVLCEQGPVSFGLIFDQIRERSHALITLFLAGPFMLPIPLPGVSIPFGCLIVMFGFALVTGCDPFLPRGLLARPLPTASVRRFARAASRFFKRTEKWFKPRLDWVIANPILHGLAGFLIMLSGALLALPLPPGTNAPPAACIVLLSIGILERDGLVLLGGFAMFAFNVIFFGLLAYFGYEAFLSIMQLDGLLPALGLE